MIEQALIKTLGFGLQQTIFKAQEGGYREFYQTSEAMLLDPKFWKACGDTEGWGRIVCDGDWSTRMQNFVRELCALAEEENSKA